MISEHLKNKLTLLPDKPGCYQMKNSQNKIIYVGKAKNLKKRVSSYFKLAHSGKTQQLVSEIIDYDYIVTNTDKESFLLEITLIQKYQPYYNIKLKKGTGYPYLKITDEKDPILKIVSNYKKDGGFYFGPYPNVYAAEETRNFLLKNYPLRHCNGYQGRPCLYYHMGQCLGACFKDVSSDIYEIQIQHIKNFLNGNFYESKNKIKHKMKKAALDMEFERAAELRDQLLYIEQTVEKQQIISKDRATRDIINFYTDHNFISVQIFFVRQARLMKREKYFFPLIDGLEEEISSFICQFYLNQSDIVFPSEILVPDILDVDDLQEVINIKVRSPKRGEKKVLMNLAGENAKIALDEKLRLMELKERKTVDATKELAQHLKVENLNLIEAFDHSHMQGQDLVSSMVVFENGKPNKKLYRKYKSKTVNKSDEFASTQEIIRRRYIRALREKQTLPDLILIDGGIIQLRAVKDILENELDLNIPVAAMVKNEKHATSQLMSEEERIIKMSSNSASFRLIQNIQTEVHRFTINFHRQIRSKNSLGSNLDNIAGVGVKTRNKLLKNYGSLDKLSKATISDLQACGISEKVARNVKLSIAANRR